MNHEPFFTVTGLTAGYGGPDILRGVEFSTAPGLVTGILGANGSGKTTLLKAVCGLLPHGGQSLLEGCDLGSLPPRQLARRCAYIPQRSGIGIDISVLDVVLMGYNPHLGLLERPTAQMKETARRALALAGLAGREEENYQTLSEGQKQLCILARTLVSGAQLLLLDEPESALDFQLRYRMLHLLRRWVRQERRAVLAALHDPMLALSCCDRLLILEEGKTLVVLSPSCDPLPELETALSAIYGPVSLTACPGRDGRRHLVMLSEEREEDAPWNL